MRVAVSSLVIVLLALAACGKSAPRVVLSSGAAAQDEKAAESDLAEPAPRRMPVTAKQMPSATLRTNDAPADAWPDYGLPLEITIDAPPVPPEIRGPSPPIVEEPPQ